MSPLAAQGQQPPDSPGTRAEPKQLVDFRNPMELMKLGGYLMWPILLCSVVTITFSLERLIALRRGRVLPRRFLRTFFLDLDAGRLNPELAAERCRQNGSSISAIILAAVKRWGYPVGEIENAYLEAGQREIALLRRNLRALQGSANLATLLGLLGTVIGMILAFNQVAATDGQPRAEMLAAGIAQALLTTAFGLAVAIPSLFLHAYFSGRVERLVYELDQVGLAVAERIARPLETIPERRSNEALGPKASDRPHGAPDRTAVPFDRTAMPDDRGATTSSRPPKPMG